MERGIEKNQQELVETRSKGSKESKGRRELIINVWERCMQNRSEEMRKGYFNIKKDRAGNESKIWIPDAREKYINSVITFDIGTKSFHDEKYKKAKEEIIKKASDCFKRWGYKTFKIQRKPKEGYYNQFQYYKKMTGEILMPEIGENGAFIEDISSDGKKYMKDWSVMYHNYMQSLVLIYDEMFEELILLLHRENYLLGETYGDIE